MSDLSADELAARFVQSPEGGAVLHSMTRLDWVVAGWVEERYGWVDPGVVAEVVVAVKRRVGR